MTQGQQVRFWLIGLVLVCLAVWLLRGVLAPFVTGMAVAYLLDPLADRLERLGTPRWLAATVLLACFFIVAVAVIVILVPVIQGQVIAFIEAWPNYLERIDRLVAPIYERLRTQVAVRSPEEIRAAIGQYAGDALSWIGTILGVIWRSGLALIDLISLAVITPVVAFYMLRDWDRMVATLDHYLPRRSAGTIRELAREVDRTLANFVRGQGTVCLVLGLVYAGALTAVGLNFAILVGLGAGLISFIPYVGTITGFVVSTGIALVQFEERVWVAVVIGIFVFGQILEGYVLTPRLVGTSVGLHPVWVMFALLAGGSLFGFTGVMLAVPVAAVIGVLVRFGLRRYRESPLFHGGVVPPGEGPPASGATTDGGRPPDADPDLAAGRAARPEREGPEARPGRETRVV